VDDTSWTIVWRGFLITLAIRINRIILIKIPGLS